MRVKRRDLVIFPIGVIVVISLSIPLLLLFIQPETLKTLVFFLGVLLGCAAGGCSYLLQNATHQLANSHKRFEDMSELSPNMVCELDTHFKIRYANLLTLKTFGFSKEKLDRGIEIPELLFKNERFKARRLLAKLLSKNEPQMATFEMQKADGTLFYAEITIAPNIDLWGTLKGFRCIIRDITALEEAHQYIEHLTLFDKRTGLPNPILLEDRLSQAILKAQARREKVVLFLAEPLHFKLIAESHGHAISDGVLTVMTKRLKEICREEDTLALTSHPEFALIMTLPSIDSKMSFVLMVAEKILENLQKPLHMNGKEFFLGAAIGIAISPEDAKTGEELIKKARAAKYHAKEQGKNTYQFYQPKLTSVAHASQDIEKRLRHAFKNEEFQLLYQPIVRGDDRTLWGVEVLPFWNHSEKGFLPLPVFLSELKSRRLVLPFIEWACARMRHDHCSWQAHNVKLPPFFLFALTPWIDKTNFTELFKNFDHSPLSFAFELADLKLAENSAWLDRKCPFFVKETGKGLALTLLKKYPMVEGLKINAHYLHNESTSSTKWMPAFWNFMDMLSVTLLIHKIDTPSLASLKEGKRLLLQGKHIAKPQSAEDLERFQLSIPPSKL